VICLPRSRSSAITGQAVADPKGVKMRFALFGYPVLQAADILGIRADTVPVGRDNAPTTRRGAPNCWAHRATTRTRHRPWSLVLRS
jgi:hypothetical protein